MVNENQPQNFCPNLCYLDKEDDIDVKEDCNVEDVDECIECVGAIDRVSLPIYNNYPKEHSQGDKVELDED